RQCSLSRLTGLWERALVAVYPRGGPALLHRSQPRRGLARPVRDRSRRRGWPDFGRGTRAGAGIRSGFRRLPEARHVRARETGGGRSRRLLRGVPSPPRARGTGVRFLRASPTWFRVPDVKTAPERGPAEGIISR